MKKMNKFFSDLLYFLRIRKKYGSSDSNIRKFPIDKNNSKSGARCLRSGIHVIKIDGVSNIIELEIKDPGYYTFHFNGSNFKILEAVKK